MPPRAHVTGVYILIVLSELTNEYFWMDFLNRSPIAFGFGLVRAELAITVCFPSTKHIINHWALSKPNKFDSMHAHINHYGRTRNTIKVSIVMNISMWTRWEISDQLATGQWPANRPTKEKNNRSLWLLYLLEVISTKQWARCVRAWKRHTEMVS